MEEDIARVSSLKDGGTCCINWFQGGGGEVIRIGSNLHLWEVSQYGGYASGPLVFGLEDVATLVKTAHSWV